MKQRYNYLEYLAEVNNLSTTEHREYLKCITVIKKHVLKQISGVESDMDILKGRLNKLESMGSIHQMMIQRLQSGISGKELVQLN
ncbi:hypothetical protein [Marinoscillum pacificum]|mgnify:CR=1 FL=1|uniref:hypothetical protein n=1 Tax=Marinoscillum pacificum TaxID=392723 RepID=UPI00215805C1|nr:hypothetical protein [Marinoscillum pacificum]|tara:strand:+ start:76 stop:330 length:255 start_codon:yes stop_codon:yes gene_type:complete